jgi:hypothetical protein
MKTVFTCLKTGIALLLILAGAGCAATPASPVPITDTGAGPPMATDTVPPPAPTAAPPTRTPGPTATAPEPYALATEIQHIAGTWTISDALFVRFDEDGTFRSAYSADDLQARPYQVSTYTLEDGRLLIRELSVSGVPSCGTGMGKYEVRLLESGGLQLILIKDGCGPRAGDTAGIYRRVP